MPRRAVATVPVALQRTAVPERWHAVHAPGAYGAQPLGSASCRSPWPSARSTPAGSRQSGRSIALIPSPFCKSPLSLLTLIHGRVLLTTACHFPTFEMLRLSPNGRHAAAPEGGDIAQQARHWDVGQRRGNPGGDRRVAQVVERADFALRCLHREIIGNSPFRFGPEIGCYLLRRALTLTFVAMVSALSPSWAARARSMSA